MRLETLHVLSILLFPHSSQLPADYTADNREDEEPYRQHLLLPFLLRRDSLSVLRPPRTDHLGRGDVALTRHSHPFLDHQLAPLAVCHS